MSETNKMKELLEASRAKNGLELLAGQEDRYVQASQALSVNSPRDGRIVQIIAVPDGASESLLLVEIAGGPFSLPDSNTWRVIYRGERLNELFLDLGTAMLAAAGLLYGGGRNDQAWKYAARLLRPVVSP
jgi:hypothetical protein